SRLHRVVYGDGRVVTGAYEDYEERYLTQGATIEFDGAAWAMYDRVDRSGDKGLPAMVCEAAGGPAAGAPSPRRPVARAEGRREGAAGFPWRRPPTDKHAI